ncbi:MAG: hypothetical protein ACLTY5_05360 [Angelakisella sp.]
MTCPALDAGEDIFLYQKKFLLRMRAYAGAHALMCEEPLILTEDKRHQSPALAGLQRAFTRPETVPPAAGESLRLIEAPTVYEEMRFAAAEIARLVREEGFRYRDCVILCRDLTATAMPKPCWRNTICPTSAAKSRTSSSRRCRFSCSPRWRLPPAA